MSQLDISIFYSHLFTLLLTLYIFSHLAVMILSVYFYNVKLRDIQDEKDLFSVKDVNKIGTLLKIFN